MKVLQVIASMDPRSGGPCQGVRNLMPLISKPSHAVEVVCLNDPHADYLAKDSLCIHALGQGWGSWSYHPALQPWLEKNLPRFDAVILNGLWQYPGYVLSRLTQQPGMPPYFVYPHGMLDPWFQRAPGRRFKAMRNWLYWKLVEQQVINRAKAVFFTCSEELRLARETFRPYEPKREINVGLGISQPPEYQQGMAAAFAQKCPGLQGRPYFLFLGRIHPKKGVDILIKAYAAVYGKAEIERAENRNQGAAGGSQKSEASSGLTMADGPPIANPLSTFNLQPSTFPGLVIAGPGLETDYGQQMQKLAADLCPPTSVFWPGMLTGDAKWDALYRAEAFVLPSHQENFGIAVAEALACARPVLISNQINIWREIAEDKAGLVGDDTLAGAEQLFRQWENLSPEDRAAMKRSAKSCYENRFVIAIAAQKLLATMEELTGCSQRLETISKNG